MRLGVIADLEQWIRHQLLDTGAMRNDPFSSGEERGFHTLLPQIIEDAAIVAGDFAALFAEIERQCDDFLAFRKIDATDGAAHGVGYGRSLLESFQLDRRIKRAIAPQNFFLSRNSGERRSWKACMQACVVTRESRGRIGSKRRSAQDRQQRQA